MGTENPKTGKEVLEAGLSGGGKYTIQEIVIRLNSVLTLLDQSGEEAKKKTFLCNFYIFLKKLLYQKRKEENTEKEEKNSEISRMLTVGRKMQGGLKDIYNILHKINETNLGNNTIKVKKENQILFLEDFQNILFRKLSAFYHLKRDDMKLLDIFLRKRNIYIGSEVIVQESKVTFQEPQDMFLSDVNIESIIFKKTMEDGLEHIKNRVCRDSRHYYKFFMGVLKEVLQSVPGTGKICTLEQISEYSFGFYLDRFKKVRDGSPIIMLTYLEYLLHYYGYSFGDKDLAID